MAICPLCGAPVKVRRSDSETSTVLVIRTRECSSPVCSWAQKTYELLSANPVKASEAHRREIERLYRLCQENKA